MPQEQEQAETQQQQQEEASAAYKGGDNGSNKVNNVFVFSSKYAGKDGADNNNNI